MKAMLVPSMLLRQLYTTNSLSNVDGGVKFSIKNRLSDASLSGIQGIRVNGEQIDLAKIKLQLDDGKLIDATSVSPTNKLDFPLKKSFDVICAIPSLEEGKHQIGIAFEIDPLGKLKFSVEDGLSIDIENRVVIPRDSKDDYSEEAIKNRQEFVQEFTGAKIEHMKHYSWDPHLASGNCEHFTGVIQVPVGFAGPLKVNGEYADGDFLIPMATTEGTLVASYNRGIKVINACGGVKTTIVRDAMQRAPVFIFEDARGARDFVDWVQANFKKIAEEAESTTRIGKLLYIDPYLSNKFAYLRFNFSTGDAAGQNMVGRATFAASSWILDNYKDNKVVHFYLESNLATDKKASQVNIMRTRGKRVTAEIVVKREILQQYMRVDPEDLVYHSQVGNVGAILSGANNNGAHSANAITAIFMATGQDVANVSESSAGIAYTELTPEKDLYISITIPSLIVASYGGGTGLPAQRECLEILDCYGTNRVRKLAEIIAGTVLAGEISLASAISSSDWVSSHETYGRNR
ncbi:MAG: hydroxymethylglutaryl-CoA reductase (NADPH) [Limisphaerales bacterium]|jgi:hydroxymethylglutaryl-CoA reductase (NADPH)